MKNPCSSCEKLGIKCEVVQKDLRRNRHTVAYVSALETHIGRLESALKLIKDTKDLDAREKILNSLEIEDVAGSYLESPMLGSSIPTQKEDDSRSLPLPRIPLSSMPLLNDKPTRPSESSPETIVRIETPNVKIKSSVGSSSIYPSNSLSISKNVKSTTEESYFQVKLKNLARSPLILRSLSLFFKWLYPSHFMFIHRETFLSAFFGDTSTKSYYCSEELVFAIAALGAVLSDKSSDLYESADSYYERSKTIVLKKLFQLGDNSLPESTSSSKLAIIQTLLCLAFYDIGNGDNPTAWYLSGLAFRMVYEIGLHLDPKAWSNVYEDELSKIDFEVRSRIYWGCYIADHLIAILFGRSTSLRLSNSTVPETDELPEIESGIEDYVFNPKVILSPANPLKKLIVLSRLTEVFARKIFTQTDEMVDRQEYLSRFNSEATNWRKDVPKEFRWSKYTLINMKEFNPTTAYVWYHFYIILISYNKPFLEETKESRHLIEEYIEELYLLLRLWEKNYHTFERCNLYMVYSTILSIQCMKTEFIKKDYMSYFLQFLESSTLHYDLGKKFVDNEKTTETADLFGTLSHGNDFALEYNFDFTLLNEIDNLIGGNDNLLH
ncbi:hypothetical protein TBLA_0D04050 [Henningerozyma blattae CBS 6284]|uniref:Xylanolytic transcriptional activator regulatory domain-containing protein n=1 Tax=Henningerozyma blattae (strain ATCC 34711 / CBS 6284 / DSM 70876 / NBRC 10599 / NRRL Y-10934 / UCD 77-7) TaxID=1071380 RepID=I2H3F0_HENB6|nr:hypothetical protein TBLA_0D04050 [Tetrapisispora blattae CBS 6284]CCH60902.1 hypothetical protein TBLA_0D04050 [Tetrapisispora blattae CBS 6284]